MTKPNEKLVEFPSPSSRDVLTDVLREGARRVLATVIEAEVADYVAAREPVVDAPGHRRVVRTGYLPERPIQTPLGDIRVQQPRVRDRRPVEERETFRSAILPPYLRRTASLEALYPWLYLKGVSTGDFGEALQAVLGPEARGLSPITITRLKTVWEQEYAAWAKRVVKGGGKLDHGGGSKFLTAAWRGETSGSRSGRVLAGFLAVFEAIAVAVQLEDVDVMGQPVEQRASHPFGAEDLGPFVEGQIRGHARRCVLVALGEDLDQQLGAGLRQRDVAELGHDQ